MSISTVHSTFVIDQNPLKYGGRQQDYEQRAYQSTLDASQKITECVESSGNLTDLFFTILDSLGKARAQIAKDHQTLKAEEFGQKRDELGTDTVHNFWAENEYKKYNTAILSLFEEKIKKMVESQLDRMKFGTKTSFLELEILSGQEVQTREWDKMPKVPFSEEAIKAGRSTPNLNDHTKKIILDKECRRIRNADRPLYNKFFIAHSFVDLFQRYPDSHRHAFAMGTVRLGINNKLYPLARYLTWLNLDKSSTRDMLKNSTLQILHMDKLLIKEVLPDITEVFKRAVTWNGKDRKEFKDIMAEFRFKLAFIMPFCRGSAAITEWFENAIYHHKGFPLLSYKKGTQLDLECFAHPSLPLFQKKYDSFFRIDPTPETIEAIA